MKTINFFLYLFIFFVFAGNTLASTNKPTPTTSPLNRAYVLNELTNHQWTLREIVRTKNDTATNLTLFLLPCEKDNQLNYFENGQYEITEGDARCKSSDENIKGKGTWEYEANQNTIIDWYEEGRPIEKRILEINPGMMKVEYEGEGHSITTLTYFSEIGQKDKALEETIEDNSNHLRNITQIPREIMIEARRYAIIGRNDYDAGNVVTIDDRNGLVKKVVVFPFSDSTNPRVTVNESERNNQLIAQAQKGEIDYIITGNIFKATTRLTGDGKKEGQVKYSVSILDVKTGEEIAQQNLEYPKDKQSPSSNNTREVILNKIGKGVKIVGSSLGGLYYFRWYSGRTYNWNRYYRTYFAANAISHSANDLSSYFSETGQDRNTYFQDNLAIMESIEETAAELGAFILEKLPVTININKTLLNKRGKVASLMLEAGNNVSVKVGEKMNVVRITETTFSDGSVDINKEVLGEIQITEVNGTRLSTGQIKTGQRKVQDALDANPDDIFVQTKEIAAEKK